MGRRTEFVLNDQPAWIFPMTLPDLTGIFGAAAASEAVRDRRPKWFRRLPTSRRRCALSLKAKIAVGAEHEQASAQPIRETASPPDRAWQWNQRPSFRRR